MTSPGQNGATDDRSGGATVQAAAPRGFAAVLSGPAILAGFVREASGRWNGLALLLIAGGLSTLAHAPFYAWPLLSLTLPLLFWSIEGACRKQRPLLACAQSGFAFAFAYFFFGLSWVGEAFLVEAEIFAWLLPFAITLLPAVMALYWALAAAITGWLWSRRKMCDCLSPVGAAARIIVLAVIFAVIEWVRGHAFTGFPWHNPGLALTAPIELMQVTALVGMYGLLPFAFAVTLTPVVALAAARTAWQPQGRHTEPPRPMRSALIVTAAMTLLPLAAAYAYGTARLSQPPSPALEGVRVRIVQPSIPQREKWRADKQAEIFGIHLDLSRQDHTGKVDELAGITHVIWPEASMPFGPLDDQEALDAIGRSLPDGVHLLAGILRRGDQRLRPTPVHNSLAAFDHTGRLVSLYDKIHLVPFGEYLPFPHILESIGLQNLVRQRGGFTPGQSPKPLMAIPGLPAVSPVICYEAIFPGEIVQGAERPGLIVIATNDGWFGRSIGPSQHFHQARVRAVEQGIPVLRSANNGISALIDPEGRVIGQLDLDVRSTSDVIIPGKRPEPWASRLGSLGLAFSIALYIFALLICKSRLAYN